MEKYIPAKNEVLIGGLAFMNDWIIRSETSNALGKLLVKDLKKNKEEEKRSRIKEMMDKYTEEMVSEGRIPEDKIGLPKFNDY